MTPWGGHLKPTKESRLVERDARPPGEGEAGFLGQPDRRFKRFPRDVDRRLHNEQLPLGTQYGLHLGEERTLIREFVEHVQREDEIHELHQADSIRLTLVQRDARFEFVSAELRSQLLEHALLEISSNDPAGGPDHACEIQSAEAGPATEVQDGHALPDVGSE